MATESCSSQVDKLVRPKVEMKRLLEEAGADQDVFTMKEVMFYLGKYIMSKELYDKQQQHMVNCGEDALGAVLGVKSFSVKEPRALFAMIVRNVVTVKDPETQSNFSERRSQSEPERGPGDVGISDSEESDESEDSDNFSVEFEVESIESDPYSGSDEDSLPGENEVYEVTIFAEDEGTFAEIICVICQSRPKNGCIVHGKTGHLMACYTCSSKLKKHNKLCPVCREPIESVVLTYVD